VFIKDQKNIWINVTLENETPRVLVDMMPFILGLENIMEKLINVRIRFALNSARHTIGPCLKIANINTSGETS